MNETTPAEIRLIDIINLLLSVVVLSVVGYDTFMDPAPEISRILQGADTAICLFFLGDFAVRFATAPDRNAFLRWGWVDLVASIPALPALRWGRLLRVLFILRVLRSIRSIHRVFHPWLKSRCKTGVSVVLLTTFLVLLTSSCLVLAVETAPQSNIKTAEEALWWSVTTITTVGYGDRYPVTTAGRMVGMVLMFTGVGLFGMLSGMVATIFLGNSSGAPSAPPTPAPDSVTVDELVKELREIRRRLDERDPPGAPPPPA